LQTSGGGGGGNKRKEDIFMLALRQSNHLVEVASFHLLHDHEGQHHLCALRFLSKDYQELIVGPRSCYLIEI
jgi:hypothetical protein